MDTLLDLRGSDYNPFRYSSFTWSSLFLTDFGFDSGLTSSSLPFIRLTLPPPGCLKTK